VFAFGELFQIDSVLVSCLASVFCKVKILNRVAKRTTDQKLERHIIDASIVGLVHLGLRLRPVFNESVADGDSECPIQVVRVDIFVQASECVIEMSEDFTVQREQCKIHGVSLSG